MRALTAFAGLLAICALVLFAPLLVLRMTTPVADIHRVEPAEVAIVFGALVRDGQISPLHQERLDAAVHLLRRGAVRKIVVSNAPKAAGAMRTYLLKQGIAPDAIEVDGSADKTPDTCRTAARARPPRSRILISQGFHLPRLAFQCRWLGVVGQYFAADSLRTGPSRASIWTRIRVRTYRHSREAILTWAALLSLYR